MDIITKDIKLRGVTDPDAAVEAALFPDGGDQAEIDATFARVMRETDAPAELLQSPLAVMTYPEAAEWIDSNVTSLATARTALKALARMVIALRNNAMSEYIE